MPSFFSHNNTADQAHGWFRWGPHWEAIVPVNSSPRRTLDQVDEWRGA